MQEGILVSELSKQLRVSPEKIRRWIEDGSLSAINTASSLCGKPRWVITQDSVARFLQQRQTGVAAVKTARAPRRKANEIDFYPD